MKYLCGNIDTLFQLSVVLRRWFLMIIVVSSTTLLYAAGPTTNGPAFNMDQTISDGAQKTTLAFSGLAMMTGNLESQSFFPPGKVADYTGFQYLRDNDPDSMGHNTSFLTRVASNVIFTLSDAQFTQLKALAVSQQNQISLYGYKRFALMKAFRRLMEGDIPVGSTGLSLIQVKKASHELYLIDGQISFDRALLYANIFNSFTTTQKAYLDAMVGKGWNSWPDITPAQIDSKMSGLPQGTSVAVMTYASDLFSWYAGSIDADVYFCPERHGTYFGSFYIKDAPAIGHEGYSIDEQLTATAGAALCDSSKGYVTDSQATLMSSLVDLQKNNLYAGTSNIVTTRTQISTLLRNLRTSTTASAAINSQVVALSGTYGDLDGENNYNYATVFAQVYKSLSDAQKSKLMDLRKSIMSGQYADGTPFDFTTCTTSFLYSAVITDKTLLSPYIDDTDYLFFDDSVVTPVLSPASGTYTSATNVTISCATTGATIRYTTDGTTPTTASTAYTGPITVSATSTITAIAFRDQWKPSTAVTGNYVISTTQQVATPTFSPSSGTFTVATQITLSCTTTGATIRYTTNGTTPTVTSTAYTGPITISATTTINAIAFRDQWTPSSLATGSYVVSIPVQTVATPTFSPASGTFTTPTQVSLSCATTGATIRYTTNGTVPTSASTAYTGPITVSTTSTITAIGFLDQWIPSSAATGRYTISATVQKVATPTLTVASGTYTSAKQIGIVCTTIGATIRYTINGAMPTSNSPIYTSQLIITKSTIVTIKAFKAGMTDSDVVTGNYVIDTVTPIQGVDLMLKAYTISPSVGEGIMDTDGSQMITKSVASRKFASYIVILKNSGNTTDTFTMNAIGSKVGWYVNVVDITGTNVTRNVMGSTGLTIYSVPAGRLVYFRLDVTPQSGVTNGDSIDVIITATSKTNNVKIDTVKTTTTKIN